MTHGGGHVLDLSTYARLDSDTSKLVKASDGYIYNKSTLAEYMALFPDKTRLVSPTTLKLMAPDVRPLTDDECFEVEDALHHFTDAQDGEDGAIPREASDALEDAHILTDFLGCVPECIKTLLQEDFGRLLSTTAVPRLVSIGPENIGKSLALQRLIGIPLFPVSDELTTRMPTLVKLRNGDPRIPRVYVQDVNTGDTVAVECRAYTGEHAGKTASLASDRVPVPFLAEAIRERMQRLMESEKDDEGRYLRVSLRYEIVVELQAPQFFNADLLDLPGIIQAEGHHYAQRPQDTRVLAERYVNRWRDHALFLVTSKVTSPPNQNPAIQILQNANLTHLAIGVITHTDQFPTELGSYGRPAHFVEGIRYGWTPLAAGIADQAHEINAHELHRMSREEDAFMVNLQPPKDNTAQFHMGGIRTLRRHVREGLEFFFAHVVIGQLVHRLTLEHYTNAQHVGALGVPFERPLPALGDGASAAFDAWDEDEPGKEGSGDDEVDAMLLSSASAADPALEKHAQPRKTVQAVVWERTRAALSEALPTLHAAFSEHMQQLLAPFHALDEECATSCASLKPSGPFALATLRKHADDMARDIRAQTGDLQREFRETHCFSSLVRDFVRDTLTSDTSTVRLARFKPYIDSVAAATASIVARDVDHKAAKLVAEFEATALARTEQMFGFRNAKLIYLFAGSEQNPSLADRVAFAMAEALTLDFEEDVVKKALPPAGKVSTEEDLTVLHPDPSAQKYGEDNGAVNLDIGDVRRDLVDKRCRIENSLASLTDTRDSVYRKDVQDSKAAQDREQALQTCEHASKSVRAVAHQLSRPDCDVSRLTLTLGNSDGQELLLAFVAHAPSVHDLTVTGLLTSEAMKQLVNCINLGHCLHYISFVEMAFSPVQLQTLLDTLASHVTFRRITFEACHLGADHVEALTAFMGKDWCCGNINLPNNNFTEADLAKLRAAAEEHANSEACQRWHAYTDLPVAEREARAEEVFLGAPPQPAPFFSQQKVDRGPTVQEVVDGEYEAAASSTPSSPTSTTASSPEQQLGEAEEKKEEDIVDVIYWGEMRIRSRSDLMNVMVADPDGLMESATIKWPTKVHRFAAHLLDMDVPAGTTDDDLKQQVISKLIECVQ